MNAQLKGFFCSDVDVQTYHPEDDSNFGIWFQLDIGLESTEGSDDFQLLVCTPKWLTEEMEKGGPVWGRHILFVPRYDLDHITQHIAKYCQECTGDDWMKIAAKLARIAHWEFEDYQEYRP